jgi:hypothetical protein
MDQADVILLTALRSNQARSGRPAAHPVKVSATVIGRFAMDYFGNKDVELDLAARKLKLFSRQHCGDRIVYRTDHYATWRRGTL